ncbi:MAG: hypothetical protein QOI24_2763 [Acidobacteriota bacterium]|jgi:hypothetical protein|nr:hypothetical protein [Acidobacteriota bacterium]
MQSTTVLEMPTFDLTSVLDQVEEAGALPGAKRSVLEREYQRFWVLCKMYPTEPIVPSKAIDKVWHQHVLNTRQYDNDCQAYFGRFLHHTPRHPESVAETWASTLRRYAEAFGFEPSEGWRAVGSICDAGGCDHGAPAICDAGGCDHG